MKYSQCEYCIEYVRYSTHIHTWNTTEYYAIFTLVFYIRILLQYAFYSHPYRHVNTLEYAAFHAVVKPGVKIYRSLKRLLKPSNNRLQVTCKV